MASPGAGTPYASVANLFGKTPSWLASSDIDAARIMAYEAYENIYWSNPETFKLVQRGEDQNPIYLPSARKMIEATNRFLAVDWDFVIDPNFGNEKAQKETYAQMMRLFKREMMYSKFGTQKRYGLIKGDAVWHITADPRKQQGERISIHEVDPASYFPIFDEENSERMIGVHLVDLITDPRDPKKSVVRRQTYRKILSDSAPPQITSERAAFEIDAWDDRHQDAEIKKVRWDGEVPPFVLEGITSLPVYHIKNHRIPKHPFGISQMRGIESIIAAVNQAISDEELQLAIAGLGLYATNAHPPDDEEGNEAEYEIGPARVVEVGDNEKFWRVSGVQSVTPSIDHMKFMLGEASQGLGVPDIAMGRVDVTVAESGISLYLQLSPLLAGNAEKEQEMLPVYDHMMYDLTKQWFPAFEDFTAGRECIVASVVGDAMPENREKAIQETITLLNENLITIEMAQARLAKLGWEFGENAADEVVQEAQRLAAARSYDPFANRYRMEIENNGGEPVGTGAN